MNDDPKYYDQDGRECSLQTLCTREPGWAASRIRTMRTALEQAERQRDEARQQAETWAQEARTQRGTVREIYQLCTGATGEPGDWNGAEPVRTLIRQRDEARGLLRECRERIGPVDLDSSTRTGILIDKIDAHLRDTGK